MTDISFLIDSDDYLGKYPENVPLFIDISPNLLRIIGYGFVTATHLTKGGWVNLVTYCSEGIGLVTKGNIEIAKYFGSDPSIGVYKGYDLSYMTEQGVLNIEKLQQWMTKDVPESSVAKRLAKSIDDYKLYLQEPTKTPKHILGHHIISPINFVERTLHERFLPKYNSAPKGPYIDLFLRNLPRNDL